MGRFKEKPDYEQLRNARMVQNQQAQLTALGLQKTLSELRSLAGNPPKRKYCVVDTGHPLRRSTRFVVAEGGAAILLLPVFCFWAFGSIFVSVDAEKLNHLEELVSRRNKLLKEPTSLRNRELRISLRDRFYGIHCHCCRLKNLCSEEDCKRCGDVNMDQPCIGKTDCSVCHSDKGIFCRHCLEHRYGEEMEEVRQNKEWMCPHCIEERGAKPYWICNSVACLKKRNMSNENFVQKARAMGYKSVAHLLMDELQKAAKKK